METPAAQEGDLSLLPKPTKDYHSYVDTSRPFSSVKEAVAMFGHRILSGEINSSQNIRVPRSPISGPSPSQAASSSSPSSSLKLYSPVTPSPHQIHRQDITRYHQPEFLHTLKKLETELEETKAELKMLKERESETEIALASLNAELHKNMSKLAKAEADAAAKGAAAAAAKTVCCETNGDNNNMEERRKELMRRMGNDYPTLAQILGDNNGEKEGYFGKKERKVMEKKKKPVVPLVGDFFFKKKGSSNDRSNPLYSSPELYFS